MLARVAAARDVASIGNEAARQLRALTGFDRVLVVGGGNLLGQSIRPGQDEYQPAILEADVTHLAVTDRTADPVPILTNHQGSRSRSTLRVATDDETAVIDSVHARAALVMPLVRDGRLWGHIACYHSGARHIAVERRSVAALFARFIALQLEVAELRAG
jgi:light-regulated signal transduction histidine kinase (bacteriophytochrome)